VVINQGGGQSQAGSGSSTASTGASNAGSSTAPTAAPGNGAESLTHLIVSGGFQSQDLDPQLGGKPIPVAQALTADVACAWTEHGDAQLNLSDDYSSLNATVGMDDNSQDGKATITVELDGDGKELGSYTVALNRSAQIDVPLRNVLRLEIKWTLHPSASGGICSVNGPDTLIIANPELVSA
jgi:hypothetical protein